MRRNNVVMALFPVLNIFSIRSIVELLTALTIVKVAGLVLRELLRKVPCA